MIPCPDYSSIVWRQVVLGRTAYYEGYRYTAVSASPTFNVSDGRVVENALDTPINATFTSSQSRTFRMQITATVGTTSELTGALQASVSAPSIPNNLRRCWDQGAQRGATNAPTFVEGWRFVAG